MSWKQPIPTDLDPIFKDDKKAKAVYKELIYCACNQDGVFMDRRGKYTNISRGQVVYGRGKFAEELGWDDMTCDRALSRVCLVYKLVSMQRNKNFTIVTINNYDEVVGMSMQMSKQRASNEQAVSTSKSVKSERVKKITTIKEEKKYEGKKLEEVAMKVVEAFNVCLDKKYKNFYSFMPGLEKALEIYTLEDIATAIQNIENVKWNDKPLKDIMTPIMLFQRKNPRGEPVDYIDLLINSKKPNANTSSKR